MNRLLGCAALLPLALAACEAASQPLHGLHASTQAGSESVFPAARKGEPAPEPSIAHWHSALRGTLRSTSDTHELYLFPDDGGPARRLPVPAVKTTARAAWVWSVSPSGRWVFVHRATWRRPIYKASARSTAQASDAATQDLVFVAFVDLQTGGVVPFDMTGRPVAWRGESLLLQTVSGGTWLFDPTAPSRAQQIVGNGETLRTVSRDGLTFTTYSGADGRPAEFLHRPGHASQRLGTLACARPMRSAAVSPDGTQLLLAESCTESANTFPPVGILRLIDVETNETLFEDKTAFPEDAPLLSWAPGSTPRVAYWKVEGPSAKVVVITSADGDIHLDTHPLDATATQKTGWTHTFSQAWSPSGSLLAWRAGNSLTLLDADKNTVVKRATVNPSADLHWSDPHRLDVVAMAGGMDRPPFPGSWRIQPVASGGPQTRAENTTRPLVKQARALTSGSGGLVDWQQARKVLVEACSQTDAVGCRELAWFRARWFPHSATPDGSPLLKACLLGDAPSCQDLSRAPFSPSAFPTLFEEFVVGGERRCGNSGERIFCAGGRSANSVPPLARLHGLTAGQSHACGLREDGTALCWGTGDRTDDNRSDSLITGPPNFGQSIAPKGVFRAIAAGWYHTCAIRDDETLACWGADDLGQSRPPPGKFAQLASGSHHSCAVSLDGDLRCWGAGTTSNPSFRRNGRTPKDMERGQAKPPSGKFRQVAASYGRTCAVDQGGRLRCWGKGASRRPAWRKPPAGRFTQVSLSTTHACALTDRGSIRCWDAAKSWSPTTLGKTFVSVSSGVRESCGRASDGKVVCWERRRPGVALGPHSLDPL